MEAIPLLVVFFVVFCCFPWSGGGRGQIHSVSPGMGVRTTGRGWDGVVEGRRQSWFWASVHPIHPRSEEVGM